MVGTARLHSSMRRFREHAFAHPTAPRPWLACCAVSTNKNPAICGGGSVWEEQAVEPGLKARPGLARETRESGGDALVYVVRLAQHVAAAPDGLDEVAALGGVGELLAELADEDVNNLQFRFVHAAVE